jgi:hypothetical protein
MRLFKSNKSNDKVKRRLVNRLRNTDNEDLIRWLDTVNTGVGKDIAEIRKSLPRNTEQALIYIADARSGAVSLLACLQVMEERINS